MAVDVVSGSGNIGRHESEEKKIREILHGPNLALVLVITSSKQINDDASKLRVEYLGSELESYVG